MLTTGAGLLAGSALAGCTGQPGTGPATATAAGPIAQASFFVFGDFAARVAGDAAIAESLVPVGQHGHGWAPGPRVRAAIVAADLFVYGLPGFQPWVDDVVRDLRSDDHGVAVVEAAAGIELLDADGHDEHGSTHGTDADDPADADPHFWLDPVRSKQAVANVRDGFVRVDPDAADAYDRTTEAYHGRLDALHDRIASVVANRSQDVVLVAGHDAFGYLHDRYGVRFESLTGLAPDDRPSPRDIERAQDLIAAHGIEYLCADPLESQRAAEQLVAETDARAVLPLTAIPGWTEAWRERGWGYEAVMTNVNLPTLERVLAVE